MEAEVSRVVRDLGRLVQPRHAGPGGAMQTAHRSATETTRQFIEQAMRENHGYTVPARWLADLDAVPDGDTGEPKAGYLVGIETPTDPTLLEPLPHKARTPGHADGGT